MASAKLPPLHRQVARVHRRLFLQSLLNRLIWCWAGAILLSVVWFLIQPYLLAAPPSWLRWVVTAAAVGTVTVLALVLTIFKAPSKVVAALSLDSEFGLKERVTTSLTLAPEQETSPAGQALLADVNQRIRDLDVGSRFPLRMSRTAALLPACAVLLALVAVFYQPPKSQATAGTSADLSMPPDNAAAIEQKMKELQKRVRERPATERAKSEELERLEAELEKIANRPRENKEQVRERVKEMTALEDMMKNREKELADKTRSLKQQLQKLDQMSAQKDGEGPAKDLEKALAEGKLDKAREEIERLTKKLQKNELTQKEKEQLKRQLKNLENKLDRLAKQKDKEQQLKQANLDPETLKREMKELDKERQKLKDLQDLAKQLGKCEKCIGEGDMEGATQNLSKAGDKLKNMGMDDQDLEDLREQLSRLQDAKDSC